MIRTTLIYLAVLTAAEFMQHQAGAQDAPELTAPVATVQAMQGEVVYADMKPVKADGKDVPPLIMDYTKNPDATESVGSAGVTASVKTKHSTKVSEL